MTQPCRLASGGRIDRSRKVSFRFNKKLYTGFRGDTVASALLANNVNLVARSFKYHRPRGIIGAGAEEANAILQFGDGARSVANLRATQTELREGLTASSVNCWPSVEFDMGSAFGFLSALLPAGFYYKTFMAPGKLWPYYERAIRRMAGFGAVAGEPDPDRYDKLNAWCDVLVAGGGPCGIAAALGAARSGARVIIADEQNELGGSLLGAAPDRDCAWVWQALSELDRNPNVRVLARCTVAGYFDCNFAVLNERVTDHLADSPAACARERLWRVRAKHVVLATGAIERPPVFAGNDLPGIMLASAVSTYINRYAVKPGDTAVVFTNNSGAYRTALDLHNAGVDVAAVVDARPAPKGAGIAKVMECGINVLFGSAVVRASGSRRITRADVMRLSGDGASVRGEISIKCDLLAVSGGWSPAVHLHAQSGGKPVFDESLACFVPGEAVQDQTSAGAANGQFALDEAVRSGYRAGIGAAAKAGCARSAEDRNPIPVDPDEPYDIRALWLVPSHGASRRAKKFVDFQNDTIADDIRLAAQEGYRSIELVKRYTALGFGTDQGKMGNVNGMAILSKELDQDIARTGTTTFRPMYTPVTFGAIAARDLGAELFDPVRKTAMHQWHVRHGAQFENVGQWKRPRYYPGSGESMRQAVDRECLAARNQVAMLDASTLGKIEVHGPDALEFLNRIYTVSLNRLTDGSCRYGFMLGEDGMVMDDGIVAKIKDGHYYLTTTTGGAAHVLSWLERWHQTEWPSLKVYLTSVTDQWAVVSISGPRSRDVLGKLVSDRATLDSGDFAFMTFKECSVAGVDARVFRVSFSGELGFEVNVPANCGAHVWEQIYEAGSEFGITPYGTESMHVLRAEKGFIIVGQDTDGSVTPPDLGMDWILARNKDFIGKRSLDRTDCQRPDRKQLVGLATDDPNQILPEGVQLIEQRSAQRPLAMIGHVTSSYWSENLQRSIALAVVKGGRSRMGSRIYASTMTDEAVPAVVCSAVFYDPQGARQNVE